MPPPASVTVNATALVAATPVSRSVSTAVSACRPTSADVVPAPMRNRLLLLTEQGLTNGGAANQAVAQFVPPACKTTSATPTSTGLVTTTFVATGAKAKAGGDTTRSATLVAPTTSSPIRAATSTT